ncbi:MAG TPA: YCF48-related protein [Acidimicrobiales bacterium]|nr:YCF48-related protein [Acidimicrobiales bacterium]
MDRCRLALVAAGLLTLVAACGKVTPRTETSTVPPATTSAPVSTSSPPATAIPRDFRAVSVTFVSAQSGWVVGTTPCVGTCPPVLLRTDDGGQDWRRVASPPIGNGTTVQSVRFADTHDGWVTTDDTVWATHDGGAHWERPVFPGVPSGDRVSDVEAAAGTVHAVFSGPPVQIATSPVHRDDWTLSPTTLVGGAGPVPHEQIVLQGRDGWIIEVDRVVIAGARLDNGAWVPWNPPCLRAGGPADLAASDPVHLVALCGEGVYSESGQATVSSFSSDGGATFQPGPAPLSLSSFGPMASPAVGDAIVGEGSNGDLIGTFDSGQTWTILYRPPSPETWQYLGFTTAGQGIAIEVGGIMLMTFDGGHDWAPVDFSHGEA